MKFAVHFAFVIALGFSAFNGFAAAPPDLAEIKNEISRARPLLQTDKNQEGLNRLNNAIIDLKKLHKINPNDPAPVFQIAITHFYLKNDEQALSSFEQMAALAPDDSTPYFYRGLILRYAKEFQSSEAAFFKACKLAPNDTENWYELGVLYYNNNRIKNAVTALERALKTDPQHENAAYKLALCFMENSQPEKAYPLLKSATQTDPSNVNTAYNFGQLCQTLGKTDEALTAFERVAQLDPNDWKALTKTIQLHQMLGHLDQRDIRRTQLFDLRKSGRVKALNEEALYCRDQFSAGGEKVMTLEYFEMTGERAIRYSFVITDETGKSGKYRITLGSYDCTNSFAQSRGELKEGERRYHLDGYYAGGSHRTFAFFNGPPAYDDVRAMVEDILKGAQKSISSTTPTPAKFIPISSATGSI